MKILLVGTGGVGEAIATIAKERPWVEQVVLTDYNRERIKEVQTRLGDRTTFPDRVDRCQQSGNDRETCQAIQSGSYHECL